jgi:hypothetical protein
MSDFQDSGAQHRALFPGAWKYWDGIVSSVALVFMVVNALEGAKVFSSDVERWISVGIAVLTAALIWGKLRGRQLGIVQVNTEQGGRHGADNPNNGAPHAGTP